MAAPSPDESASTRSNIPDAGISKWSIPGRIDRSRFTGMVLFCALYAGLFVGIAYDQSRSLETWSDMGGTLFVVLINTILVGSIVISVTIQRLHDLDLSGWCGLLLLVPIINIGGLLYLLLKEGDPASNRYGTREGASTAADS